MQIIDRNLLIIYLPVALFVYWKILRSRRSKLYGLLFISLAFYSLAGWKIFLFMVGLSLSTYVLARRRRFWFGITLNLLALGVFKYWGFGIEQLTRLGFPDALPVLNLVVPLGLSYYVFKHLGYLLDLKNQRYPAASDWVAFLTFSALLFQISAGPISSFNDTGNKLTALPDVLLPDQQFKGLLYLSVGLAKKLLLADLIFPIFELDYYHIHAAPHGFLTMWVYLFLRGIHLYLDFSGYTDIVLGLAFWFGLSLPENFDSPYTADNPADFWKRWHISLSEWFRIYLFNPTSRFLLKRWGASGKLLAQFAANLLTMSLVGLWHGAGWGFVFWGVYHGIVLNLHAWISQQRNHFATSGWYRLVTLLAIMFGWVFFFSPGVGSLRVMIASLLGFNGLGSLSAFWALVPRTMFLPLGVAALVTFSGLGEARNLYKTSNRAIALMAGILLVVLLSLSGAPSDFTYTNF